MVLDCGLRRNDEGENREGRDAGGWAPYGPPAVQGDRDRWEGQSVRRSDG